MSSSQSPVRYELFVGVDIAAATASAVWQTSEKKLGKAITIEQSPEGFTVLQRTLLLTHVAPGQVLVVMESTGTYWLSLATFLVRQGFVVSVINPAQAHYFAKALLRRAKTDAIDAQTLAQLAALLQPEPWTPPPAIYEELEQRLTQRDALFLMRGQLRNQLHALRHCPVVVAQVRTRMEALDETLTAHIAEVEAELASVLPAEITDAQSPQASPEQSWAPRIALLQTIPGMGQRTAMWIVVATMNLTICTSAEQAAASAGLAPMPHQSGTRVTRRPGSGHTGNGR
jgi:transposase